MIFYDQERKTLVSRFSSSMRARILVKEKYIGTKTRHPRTWTVPCLQLDAGTFGVLSLRSSTKFRSRLPSDRQFLSRNLLWTQHFVRTDKKIILCVREFRPKTKTDMKVRRILDEALVPENLKSFRRNISYKYEKPFPLLLYWPQIGTDEPSDSVITTKYFFLVISPEMFLPIHSLSNIYLCNNGRTKIAIFMSRQYFFNFK